MDTYRNLKTFSGFGSLVANEGHRYQGEMVLKRLFVSIVGIAGLLIAGAQAPAASAWTYGPDKSFSNGGAIKYTGDAVTENMVVDSRGRLLTAIWGNGSKYHTFLVAAYLPNGKLDKSFGFEGSVSVGATNRNSFAKALAVQPDGQILGAGVRTDGNFAVAPVLYRFSSRGKRDKDFKINVSGNPTNTGMAFTSVVALAGGKSLVGGSVSEFTRKKAAVVLKFKKSGKLDRNFGKRGKIMIRSRQGDDATATKDLYVLKSEKILVSGLLNGRPFLVRLEKNGDIDKSFGGGNGLVRPPARDGSGCLGRDICSTASLAVTPAGDIRILANDAYGKSGKQVATVFAYTKSGQLDQSFGKRGKVTALRGTMPYGASDLISPSDSSLVVLGSKRRAGLVARVLPSGKLDRRFLQSSTASFPGDLANAATAGVAIARGKFLAASSGEPNYIKKFEPSGR